MNEIKGFRNSNILINDRIIKTNLVIENGKIKYIGPCEVDNLKELDDELIIVPGFIDEHIHGVSGYDVMDASIDKYKKMSIALASEGTTSYLATTTTESILNINKALKEISKYVSSKYEFGSSIIGIHLEGPFLSYDYKGAQLETHLIKPNKEIMNDFIKNSDNLIKLVTLAPEIDKDNLIEFLIKQKINVSVGHSNATYEEVTNSIRMGASSITHMYNACRKVHHREIGVVGAGLLNDNLYTEIICDGIHVCFDAIDLLLKTKPMNKIILVTDSLRSKNLPDGKYKENDQEFYVKNGIARLLDGTIAGSNLKMCDAIKNIIENTDTKFIDAINFATKNPAIHLGVYDQIGSIEIGKLANLTIIDKNINVYKTIREGIVIYNKENYD